MTSNHLASLRCPMMPPHHARYALAGLLSLQLLACRNEPPQGANTPANAQGNPPGTATAIASEPTKAAQATRPATTTTPSGAAVAPAQPADGTWASIAKAVAVPGTELAAHVLFAPDANAVLAAPLTLLVHRILAQPGDAVAAGQALVEVTVPAAGQAAAQIIGITAELAALSEKRTSAAAMAAEGLGRKSEVASLDAELAARRTALWSAQATLRAAGIPEGQAGALLRSGGRFTMRAPFAGIVTSVDAVRGSTVAEGSELCHVQAASAGRIEAHTPVALGPDEYWFVTDGDQAVPVQLVNTSPSPDASGQRLAWFAPRDAQAKLIAGQRGVVRRAAAADVWLVPPRGVLRKDAQSWVWRKPTAGAEGLVEVQVLAVDGAVAYVRGALQSTDKISLEPAAQSGDNESAGGHDH